MLAFCRELKKVEYSCKDYNDERFKYTFFMCRNTFKYISEKIRGGIQKQIVTELPIRPEMRLAIGLYNLTRGD